MEHLGFYDVLKEILHKHQENEVMIDSFCMWAQVYTVSKHFTSFLDTRYQCIEKNLKVKYPNTDPGIILKSLKTDCETLILAKGKEARDRHDRYHLPYNLQNDILEEVKSLPCYERLKPKMMQIREWPINEQRLILFLKKYISLGLTVSYDNIRISPLEEKKFQGLFNLAFDSKPLTLVSLVKSGLLFHSIYVPTTQWNRYDDFVVPEYAKSVFEELDNIEFTYTGPDEKRQRNFIEAVFHDSIAQKWLIEKLSEKTVYQPRSYDLVYKFIDQPDFHDEEKFIQSFQDFWAINPFLVENLKTNLQEMKSERVLRFQDDFNETLRHLEQKYQPESRVSEMRFDQKLGALKGKLDRKDCETTIIVVPWINEVIYSMISEQLNLEKQKKSNWLIVITTNQDYLSLYKFSKECLSESQIGLLAIVNRKIVCIKNNNALVNDLMTLLEPICLPPSPDPPIDWSKFLKGKTAIIDASNVTGYATAYRKPHFKYLKHAVSFLKPRIKKIEIVINGATYSQLNRDKNENKWEDMKKDEIITIHPPTSTRKRKNGAAPDDILLFDIASKCKEVKAPFVIITRDSFSTLQDLGHAPLWSNYYEILKDKKNFMSFIFSNNEFEPKEAKISRF